MMGVKEVVTAISGLTADEIRTRTAEVDAELRILGVMLRAAEAAERAEKKGKVTEVTDDMVQ